MKSDRAQAYATLAASPASWPPVLRGRATTLRPLKKGDAPSLLAAFESPRVSRFITPAPTSLAQYEEFIAWARRVGRARRHFVYGVVPEGLTCPVGLMHLWKLETDFSVAECGFVLAESCWGTGIFVDGAEALLRFAFDDLHVHRLEARSAVDNGRGNGAMRKIGLSCEGRLRSCFRLQDQFVDHYMWAALASEWRSRGAA